MIRLIDFLQTVAIIVVTVFMAYDILCENTDFPWSLKKETPESEISLETLCNTNTIESEMKVRNKND